ncbi:MAG TPA: anthranilate synthase component I, partial [Balneola sp.]|nr:anthranilate synthase component I [Balneola sp.]
MNKNQFLKLSKDYTAIPVYKRLLADVLTPVSLFMNIREGARNPFLLESVEGGEQLARYSFIGRNPYQTLQFDGATTSLSNKTEKVEIERPYFEELKSQTTKYTEPKIPELPRLTGGAVGFSAYDTFRLVEDLPDVPDDDLHLPEAVWCFYDEIYAFDHVKHQVILIKTVFTDETSDPEKQYESALISLEEMESAAMSGNYKRREFSIDPESLVSNIERDQFKNMVNTAKDYIYEGDIFQVVLSQRFEA